MTLCGGFLFVVLLFGFGVVIVGRFGQESLPERIPGGLTGFERQHGTRHWR